MLYTIMRRTYIRCKVLLRTYRSNNYQIPKATISTRDRLLVTENRAFLNSPIRNELKSIQTRFEYARRTLVDNVLKRVTNTLAADLRRRSARQLFNGNPSSFFALVGVSLASGNGLIRRDEEFEGVCWEIREAVFRYRKNLNESEDAEFGEDFSLNNLEFGSIIAKGCNAVVYEARVKTDEAETTEAKDYPFAVKMMFNYDAESNAIAILRSMYREMVPLQNIETKSMNFWEFDMSDRIQRLPPHVNIVKMYQSFTDYIPEFPDSQILYPDALPYRLNPRGFGRNMSLFLVMKKYGTDLKQFLADNTPDIRDRIILLCQLMEAVTHINRYSIAHRDLKSDNILLDTSDGENSCPLLVVTDFGCCLADKYFGLRMPYRTPDVDKGGNPALMAPEVLTASCGMFSSIDYSKADLWTVGTLAYEIFTQKNPFYRYVNQTDDDVLRSSTYTEDKLPKLPDAVPSIIANLVRAILVRNPAQRLDAETAATICQLYLWAPSHWLQSEKLPASSEILQWLLSLTTKVLYEGPLMYKNSELKRTSVTEYQLIATFLQRVKLNIITKALTWIHDV